MHPLSEAMSAGVHNAKPRLCLLILISLGTPAISISADVPDFQCPSCGPVEVVTDITAKTELVERLQKSFLRRIGDGRITACSLVVEEGFGRGFSAVGGACDVALAGRKARWMICSDDGVGNFSAATGVRFLDPKLYLTQFLQSNCVGG
jgi:hypothetical protein